MHKRSLGSTGIDVSVLGLGTVKFGRNQGVKYPEAFELPQDNDIASLLACAKELGINLLDTAPAYGSSEERLGALLKGARQDWVIVSKVGEEFNAGQSSFDFSAKAIKYSIERSLTRLKTDYLDSVLVHSDGDDVRIIQQENVFETLAGFKQQGKIRSYGMSTKTLAGGLLACELSDVVMVTYRPDYQQELPIIQLAEKLNKGIFIKKALASGHLKTPVSEVLPFILAQQAVSSVIVGTLNPAHLRANVEVVSIRHASEGWHPGKDWVLSRKIRYIL